MKIRLITFHTPKNYGAVLQAFSLMKAMETFSDDVRVIDYNTPHLRDLYKLMKKPRGVKGLIKFVLNLPLIPLKKQKYKKFEKFVAEKLKLTKRFESIEELRKETPDGDVFFTGSDQVFNPNRIKEEREAFFLDFLPKGARKFSYAASFGIGEVDEEKREEYTEYLESFSRVSVREKDGVALVKGLCDKDTVQVLDPVFLNDKEFWSSVAKPYKKKYKKYLFYYRLLGSKQSDELAMKLAREKGLRLVVMSDTIMRNTARLPLMDVGPEEFLFLMGNADFIVTDSFHGVAFSLIFEKQFVFSDNNKLTMERGYNLLEKVGIERKAFLETYSENSLLDYEKIGEKLCDSIDFSKKYIADCIKEVEND